MGVIKLLVNILFFVFATAYASSMVGAIRSMGKEAAHAQSQGLMSLSQWNHKLMTPRRR